MNTTRELPAEVRLLLDVNGRTAARAILVSDPITQLVSFGLRGLFEVCTLQGENRDSAALYGIEQELFEFLGAEDFDRLRRCCRDVFQIGEEIETITMTIWLMRNRKLNPEQVLEAFRRCQALLPDLVTRYRDRCDDLQRLLASLAPSSTRFAPPAFSRATTQIAASLSTLAAVVPDFLRRVEAEVPVLRTFVEEHNEPRTNVIPGPGCEEREEVVVAAASGS